MKKLVAFCVLLLVAALALGVAASAANMWDVRWDADQKPEDGACNWDTGKVSPAPPNNTHCSIVAIGGGNNAMYVDDNVDGSKSAFYRQRLDPAYDGGVTIEARMDPRLASSNQAVILGRIASSRGVVQVNWWKNTSTTAQIIVNKSGSGGGLAATVSYGAYHTFRLTEDSTGWKLWVDNTSATPTKSGTVAAYTTEPANDRNEIGFGESGSGRVQFYTDYCYIETTGAYAPTDVDAPQVVDPYIKAAPTWESTVPDQVVVRWDTSSKCDSAVYYRLVGTETFRSASVGDSVTSHNVEIGELAGGNTYDYYVQSTDTTNGNTVTSGIRQFTPIAQVRILYGYSYGPVVAPLWEGTGYRFEWRATAESDSYVYYRINEPGQEWQVAHDPTMVPRFDTGNQSATSHRVDVTGLVRGKVYQYYMKSTHPLWGEGKTDIATLTFDFAIMNGPEALCSTYVVDPGPPEVIDHRADIRWDTSFNGSETVYYRQIGSPSYTAVSEPDTGVEHSVAITGLLAPAQYEYYVESTFAGPGGGTVRSPVKCFETYTEPGGNLLQNGGFETGDLTGWTAFGDTAFAAAEPSPGYHNAATHSGRYRLYSAAQGQQRVGGAYQRVTVPGSGEQKTLYAGVWALTHEISYNNDASTHGYHYVEYWTTHVSDYVMVGIDPTGGTDSKSSNITWSAPIYSNMKGHPYVPVGVSATVVGGSTATVFIKGISDGTWKQHIVCMDDAWAGVTPAMLPNNISIVENGPMSVTFNWTTPAPATSLVQYTWNGAGTPDTKWWFAYDDSLVTNHSVTVDNMFLPDVTQNYRLQAISAYGMGVSSTGVFRTQPIGSLENGSFDASSLAWDLDLGLGQVAIPWVKFGAGTGTTGFAGVSRDGAYPMHGIVSHSPTHALIFEEGYSTADDLGGVYQRIKIGTAKAGQMYQVTAKILTYGESPDPWIVNNRIGIDPSGGTDATSDQIIWGPWMNTNRAWGDALCAAIVGEGVESWDGYITVFLQTNHQWGISLNLTAFDDVQMKLAEPATAISDVKVLPLGWPVDIGNDGVGMLVTKDEVLDEGNPVNSVSYCWIQDSASASGIKVRLDKLSLMEQGYITRGTRVRVRGITNRRDLRDFYWGDTEIVAQKVDIISTGNDDLRPVGMSNSALAGADVGIIRGATGASGGNNVGLLVKTTGRVVGQGMYLGFGIPYYFFIDDGSGLDNPMNDYGNLKGIKVWDPNWEGLATMPDMGAMVEVTGVSCLEVYDPTPIDPTNIYSLPNGSGDEVLMRSIRMRDGLDLEIVQK